MGRCMVMEYWLTHRAASSKVNSARAFNMVMVASSGRMGHGTKACTVKALRTGGDATTGLTVASTWASGVVVACTDTAATSGSAEGSTRASGGETASAGEGCTDGAPVTTTTGSSKRI